jgi:omega-6 fatty acid desaturase (delta-12 desaturase)
MKTPLPTSVPVIAPGTPLPRRKQIREWLAPVSQRQTLRGVLLLAFDLAVFLLLLAAVVLLPAWWMKLPPSLLAGFWIGRLFIIGHDACHQSYTPHRRLNRWLGRIAFLPSLTPYSLWEVGHNVVHHGFTNLKSKDFVWQPLTREEYAALSPARQWLERVYRSGWAPGLYYFIEMWWLRMLFPSKAYMPARRGIFVADGLLAVAAGTAWIALLAWAAQATGQSAWVLAGFGFAVPFAFWNAMIGFVVYVHHTHTSVQWHEEKAAWSASDPFVSTTVHLTFPFGLGAAMHHIMEHTAHHVDMGIPLYHLREAQAILEKALPGRIIVQRFSWRWYAQTAKRCKLYDVQARQWLDFRGRPTPPTTHGRVVAA